MTVGIGFDIHKLAKGRKLVLGGVKITHPKGLLGHSDGDVVLHALCDAILGASGGGDIGEKFPDTDERYKDIASNKLVSKVVDEIKGEWSIENVDINIFAEEPKLGNIKRKIRNSIAGILNIDSSSVNVKAKSMNECAVSAKNAIAAQVVVSLIKI
ncbi:MAG: 2-C-methyl-D-erythritol 2,4-cyclodiphosphate synthase [Planctomycetes bacterium RBG_16_41_13]|nr:MAG: 2-C-methyl-D-erythritol 2,4-cyclodiphosphate synthase [Planctomycetes bacterium RBG_16_41_13]